jgi:hypothetical protein
MAMHNHVQILEFIRLQRESIDGAEIAYTQGSCIRFAMILQYVFHGGVILYDQNHAIYEYEGLCYDINGIAKKGDHKPLINMGINALDKILRIKYKINHLK